MIEIILTVPVGDAAAVDFAAKLKALKLEAKRLFGDTTKLRFGEAARRVA